MHVYLATDLTEGKATPMDDERIEIAWFKRKEVALLIQNGKIEDAKTLIGFYGWKRGT
jgi:ADP-ribose pyrophosphatase